MVRSRHRPPLLSTIYSSAEAHSAVMYGTMCGKGFVPARCSCPIAPTVRRCHYPDER